MSRSHHEHHCSTNPTRTTIQQQTKLCATNSFVQQIRRWRYRPSSGTRFVQFAAERRLIRQQTIRPIMIADYVYRQWENDDQLRFGLHHTLFI